ncbi:hypothetical protein BGX38DRAFT_1264638 [Terfezia claveryi]|nr:hypothetical protein BGX38DRAFT_1264638 [Terfezia claveryi]
MYSVSGIAVAIPGHLFHQDQFELDDEDIDIISKNKVTGLRKVFMFPEGAKDSDINLELQDRRDPRRLNCRMVAKTRSITIAVSTRKRPFSSWTFNDVKAQLGIHAGSYSDLPKAKLPMADVDMSTTQIKDTIGEIIKTISICPAISSGTERS